MQVLIKLCGLICLIFPFGVLKAQHQAKQNPSAGYFYFAFGTHRSVYSHSDIRLKSSAYPAFDFTLKNVEGKDDGRIRFDKGAPQYNYQLGYYNTKSNWGLEFNFDHIKYFVRHWQRVAMKGTIGTTFYNTDTVLTPDFIQLEHSDGGNYALIKWVKQKKLDQNQKNLWQLLFKAGAGPVIPKTNSTIMGKHRDDRYKISGYVLAVEAALRYQFSPALFAEANTKSAYANYNHFLIADGTGSQQWLAVHVALLVGVRINTR